MPWYDDPYSDEQVQTPAYESDDDLQDREQETFLHWGRSYDPGDINGAWGKPNAANSPWSPHYNGDYGNAEEEEQQPQPRKRQRMGRESSKRTHLVKTSFWGRKTYHDPKTGRELKKTNPRSSKLQKPGWF